MDSFHDVRFPTAISFGATGGPERRNEIVALTSGHERRNLRMAHSRRQFDVGTGVRSLEDLQAIVAFFEARRGSFHAFRFRDPFDDGSGPAGREPDATDQALGTGDGETADFQLVKTYGGGADAYGRPIYKPVGGTVRVAVNGVEMEAGTDFTVDHATGTVTFAAGAIPGPGSTVTAGFLFDIAARFDTDRVEISLTSFRAGQIPTIPVIEVLQP